MDNHVLQKKQTLKLESLDINATMCPYAQVLNSYECKHCTDNNIPIRKRRLSFFCVSCTDTLLWEDDNDNIDNVVEIKTIPTLIHSTRFAIDEPNNIKVKYKKFIYIFC